MYFLNINSKVFKRITTTVFTTYASMLIMEEYVASIAIGRYDTYFYLECIQNSVNLCNHFNN